MAEMTSENRGLPSEEELRELSIPAQIAYAGRYALRVLPLAHHPDAESLEKGILFAVSVAAHTPGPATESYESEFFPTLLEEHVSSPPASAIIHAAKAATDFLTDPSGDLSSTVFDGSRIAAECFSGLLDETVVMEEFFIDFRELRSRYPAAGGEEVSVDPGFFSGPLWHNLDEKEFAVIERHLSGWLGFVDEEGREAVERRYRAFLDSRRFSAEIPWKEVEEAGWLWLQEQPGLQTRELKTGASSKRKPETETTQPGPNTGGAPSSLGSGLSDTDLLGRLHLVESVADMIASPKQETPFTIGLLGDWGSGKSNLMYLIRKHLENRSDATRFYFADFNAWQYEHTDNMAAGVAQEVLKGLLAGKTFGQQVTIRIRFGIRENGWLVPVLMMVLLLVAGVSFVMILLGGSQGWLAALGASGLVLGGFIKRIFTILEHPLTAKINSYLKLPSYVDHLGTIPMLKRHLQTLCDLMIPAGREPPSRLVVFVDDLDRCEPQAISRTLDAIRLVMDIENVVVLIGIDHRIAFRAVEKQYQELADDQRTSSDIARDYLGKIIQLPVTLHRPNRNDLNQFISDALFSVDTGKTVQEDGPPPESAGNRKEASAGELTEYREDRPVPEITSTDGGSRTLSGERGTAASGRADEPSPVVEENEAERNGLKDMTESGVEKKLFSELCHLFDLHNPRQLIRLRNCYRLLKRISRQHHDWQEKMTMLFWLEFLYAQKQHIRLKIEEGLQKQSLGEIEACMKAEKINHEIFDQIVARFGLNNSEFEEYERLETSVRRLVLPHSESPVRAKQEEQSRQKERDDETETTDRTD